MSLNILYVVVEFTFEKQKKLIVCCCLNCDKTAAKLGRVIKNTRISIFASTQTKILWKKKVEMMY